MVFVSGIRLTRVDLFYGNDILKNVSSFTYLGVTLTLMVNFIKHRKPWLHRQVKLCFR